VISMLAGVTDG